MNVTIPRQLHLRLERYARGVDMTADEYARVALENALKEDEDLAAEMQLWETASVHDFNAFAHKHKL